jgi:hypothetical protein
MVFNNILLNDGFSCKVALRLIDGMGVDICFRDEASITWNVTGSFSSSNANKIRK